MNLDWLDPSGAVWGIWGAGAGYVVKGLTMRRGQEHDRRMRAEEWTDEAVVALYRAARNASDPWFAHRPIADDELNALNEAAELARMRAWVTDEKLSRVISGLQARMNRRVAAARSRAKAAALGLPSDLDANWVVAETALAHQFVAVQWLEARDGFEESDWSVEKAIARVEDELRVEEGNHE